MSSLFDVSGKVVLVTGGSRGIGEMIARGFVEAGAKVYISSRKADVCDALAKELSETGSCTSLPADLSTEVECQRLANEIAAREDHLDVLVNNAGATWGAPMDDYDEKAWERVLALNVKGVFHVTKFLRPLLDANGTRRESVARDQHWLDRRYPRPDDGDVCVFGLQGRGPPTDAPPRQEFGAEDHGERHRSGTVPFEDDAFHS
jgi:NAD(P)-dependent dehydrogenase (short-subunit alcohol dehydrogenase family)